MRIGLQTGLVVVGTIGNDLHMEYLAIGDTVNLAARLQAAAEPDSILISATTARLVKHAFRLEARGPLELKGDGASAGLPVLERKPMPETGVAWRCGRPWSGVTWRFNRSMGRWPGCARGLAR
jgi:class 3 adenylate cyclase